MHESKKASMTREKAKQPITSNQFNSDKQFQHSRQISVFFTQSVSIWPFQVHSNHLVGQRLPSLSDFGEQVDFIITPISIYVAQHHYRTQRPLFSTQTTVKTAQRMLYLDRSIEQFVRWKKSYVKGVGPGVFAKQFDAIYSQVEL